MRSASSMAPLVPSAPQISSIGQRPVSFEPAETDGLTTSSASKAPVPAAPAAASSTAAALIASASRAPERPGSRNVVGTTGKPAAERSQRYVLSVFHRSTPGGLTSSVSAATRSAQSRSSARLWE